MKGQKQKHKIQQNPHNHPTIFSISIFESAQEFIAVYLALESKNDEHKIHGGKYLQGLLNRTKSPPIALTYTKEFTLLKSESQIQLSIIRFISQLSDLSAGKSMQSSLSFIIDNSSFLTELRHNLTHRVMVKGLVIERGQEMILSELKEKYWKVMFEKIWKTYFIDSEKVENYFSRIISQNNQQQDSQPQIANLIEQSHLHRQYMNELENQQLSKLSFNYLFKSCQSNYQFKSLLKGYVIKKILPGLQGRLKDGIENEENEGLETKEIDREMVSQYLSLNSLSESSHFNLRSIILFSTLLDVLLSLDKYQQLSGLSQTRQILSRVLIILVNQLQSLNNNNTKQPNSNKSINPSQVLCSPVVMKKLKQVYLLKYIQEYNMLIESLPQEIVSQIKKYWQQKEIQMGKQLIVDF